MPVIMRLPFGRWSGPVLTVADLPTKP